MINLYDANSNARLCEITEDQLQYLQKEMEEEFSEDQDYAITGMLLDYFDGQSKDLLLIDGLADLFKLLRQALGEQEELLVRWARE
ncbi:MAG TPA: hypothetical protein PKM21_07170 [Anaerolineales bacterium]|nr:hypothetical protein [Anaerolineales bacterium]